MSISNIIKVKVSPKSACNHIEESLEGDLKVKLKSAPIKGQANQELIAILAEYYKIPKSCVRIIKGFSSKNKTIELIK